MQYTYEDDVRLSVEPSKWNKNSGKEVLQYCVGGLLYMPASNTSIAGKIISGEYGFVKSMVLDLEDSLGDDMVGFGQRSIKDTMAKLASAIDTGEITIDDIPLIFIRVRKSGQMEQAYTELGDTFQYVTGFIIPKFDDRSCDPFIEEFTSIREYTYTDFGTELYIMPIIESKRALYRQLRMDNLLYINNAIRPIANSVLNIRVGGADFCSIFGVRRDIESTIYEIGPVSSCLNDILNMFSKSYTVSAPVWEYFGTDPDGLWADGLRRELRRDRLAGFIGKTSIHPSQLPIIQKSLIISRADYIDALGVLGMNANTVGVKKSESGNRMSEVKTHTKWAQKIVGIANVYGVKED